MAAPPTSPELQSIPTAPFHGSQVLFSPFSPHKLALAGARNYGIAGKVQYEPRHREENAVSS